MRINENNIVIKYFKSKIGELIVGTHEDKLCICDWRYRKMRDSIDARIQKGIGALYVEGNSELIELTIQQLTEYLQKNRQIFDIPLKFVGTDFQKQVWTQLLNIPFGKIETYLGLSQKMKNEGAIRAIASANGANAISIIVPCHRIIGSDGKLVGYAGGLEAKKKLLQIENSYQSNQLQLFE